MNDRLTCATNYGEGFINEQRKVMCPHCSSAKFAEDEKEPHWECKKYNTRLYDNENNYLLRCEACLLNGD